MAKCKREMGGVHVNEVKDLRYYRDIGSNPGIGLVSNGNEESGSTWGSNGVSKSADRDSNLIRYRTQPTANLESNLEYNKRQLEFFAERVGYIADEIARREHEQGNGRFCPDCDSEIPAVQHKCWDCHYQDYGLTRRG